MATFRAATEDEDQKLSFVLCNAFTSGFVVQAIFENNVEQMFNAHVKAKSGFQPADRGFVQMIAINPRLAGERLCQCFIEMEMRAALRRVQRRSGDFGYDYGAGNTSLCETWL